MPAASGLLKAVFQYVHDSSHTASYFVCLHLIQSTGRKCEVYRRAHLPKTCVRVHPLVDTSYISLHSVMQNVAKHHSNVAAPAEKQLEEYLPHQTEGEIPAETRTE